MQSLVWCTRLSRTLVISIFITLSNHDFKHRGTLYWLFRNKPYSYIRNILRNLLYDARVAPAGSSPRSIRDVVFSMPFYALLAQLKRRSQKVRPHRLRNSAMTSGPCVPVITLDTRAQRDRDASNRQAEKRYNNPNLHPSPLSQRHSKGVVTAAPPRLPDRSHPLSNTPHACVTQAASRILLT